MVYVADSSNVRLQVFAYAPPANADWSFEGQWFNVDRFTGGIAVLDTFQAGTNLMLHAGGACNPTDCQWGPTSLTIIHDPSGLTNDVATATFDFGFETDAFTMVPLGNDLFVTNFNSRGFNESDTFSRQPPLAIYNFQTNLVLIWPYEATNFVLQVSTNLNLQASWTTATNAVTVQALSFTRPSITDRAFSLTYEGPTAGPAYFRLKH
jgi:hypothetical protein